MRKYTAPTMFGQDSSVHLHTTKVLPSKHKQQNSLNHVKVYPLSTRSYSMNPIASTPMMLARLACLLALLTSTSAFAPSTALPRTTASPTQLRAFESAGVAVDTFFQTQPYLSAFLTCSFKASAADFMAQTKQQENDSIDVARNLAFLVYGGLYQGMAQQFIYNQVFPDWFSGVENTFEAIALQVAVDMLLVGPLVCLPTAYVMKQCVATKGGNVLEEAWAKYWSDITEKGLLVKFWSIWVPVQFVTFGVIPAHFRVVFVAFFSFFWVFLLSMMSSDDASTEESIAKPVSSSKVVS